MKQALPSRGLAALAAAFLLASGVARSESLPIVHLLVCSDARQLADSGYAVTVFRDLSRKKTFAQISALSILGPRPLETIGRVKVRSKGTADVYSGKAFRLTVPKSADDQGRTYSRLELLVKGGEKIDLEMLCNR